MAQKVYTTPMAALKAAQRKIAHSKIGTVDGTPVLIINITGLSGQHMQDYLTPAGAAKKAGIKYQPKDNW